jgi:hypothetical protein
MAEVVATNQAMLVVGDGISAAAAAGARVAGGVFDPDAFSLADFQCSSRMNRMVALTDFIV